MKNQSLIITGYDDIDRVHRWAKRCFGYYVTGIIKGWNGLRSFAVMPLGRKHAATYRDEDIATFQMLLSAVKTDVDVIHVTDNRYDRYNEGELVPERNTTAEVLI